MERLLQDEIAVWHFPVPTVVPSSFWSLLSDDEKARAEAFHFPKDRARFSFCRGMLRKLLSHYLCLPASIMCFSYNQCGKPFLTTRPFHFNLSHTSDYAAFAFAGDLEVGIDVEKVGALPDVVSMAKQLFSPYECHFLENLSLEEQENAFYRLWTRHEAGVKAVGLGLGKAFPTDNMCVEELSIAQGYSCHLAYVGTARKVTIYDAFEEN